MDKLLQAHACYDRMRSAYYNFMNNEKINNDIDEFATAACELMALEIENPFPMDVLSDNAAATPEKGTVITGVKEE